MHTPVLAFFKAHGTSKTVRIVTSLVVEARLCHLARDSRFLPHPGGTLSCLSFPAPFPPGLRASRGAEAAVILHQKNIRIYIRIRKGRHDDGIFNLAMLSWISL